ncbi:MAG TPA: threonine/serine dehydratase [Gemmatimonadales bacterium]
MTFQGLSLTDLEAAQARIGTRVHRTPLLSSTLIGARIGAGLWLKCESLQRTGSFKPRGVLNKLSQLDPGARNAGVVTVSAGNHAQALAWAAREVGVPAVVVMPAKASPAKIEASRSYGGEVILHGTALEAFAKARELATERGLAFIHPFDDAQIVAGAASVGLEILDQLASVTTVVVPVGGGGLISGIAAAIKQSNPAIRVFGVEPEGCAAMRASLDAGHAVRLDAVQSVADGLAAPMAGELNFAIVREWVDEVVLVSDVEIVDAMEPIASRARLVVEPSGAAGVAALLAGRIPLGADDTVVAVLSGGNVGMEDFAALITRDA